MNKNLIKKGGKIVVGVGALIAALFSIGEAKDAFKDAKELGERDGVDGLTDEEVQDLIDAMPTGDEETESGNDKEETEG